MLLLACAAGSVLLARGTADAAQAFRAQQAEWQRGLEPAPAASPGPAQRAGEAMLGIGASSDVLRSYQAYRAGLANVIRGHDLPADPGAVRGDQDARTAAVVAPEQQRTGRRADVVLGVILTDAASSAGPQREARLRRALVDAFVRAVREDPANATAKLDLEVLLQATAPRTKSRPRPSGSPNRKRRSNENPRNPTAPARAEGDGVLSRCCRLQISSS